MIEASTTLGWLHDFSARAELTWTICSYRGSNAHWTATVAQRGPGIVAPLAGRGRAERIEDAMRAALADLHYEPEVKR